jgi:hypothetical protein
VHLKGACPIRNELLSLDIIVTVLYKYCPARRRPATSPNICVKSCALEVVIECDLGVATPIGHNYLTLKLLAIRETAMTFRLHDVVPLSVKWRQGPHYGAF